jgi:hypothetical protein
MMQDNSTASMSNHRSFKENGGGNFVEVGDHQATRPQTSRKSNTIDATGEAWASGCLLLRGWQNIV